MPRKKKSVFQSYYYSKVRASGPHEVHPPPCPVETPVSRFPPLGFCAPHVGDVVGVRSIFRVLFGLVHLRSGSLNLRISRIPNFKIRSFLSGHGVVQIQLNSVWSIPCLVRA